MKNNAVQLHELPTEELVKNRQLTFRMLAIVITVLSTLAVIGLFLLQTAYPDIWQVKAVMGSLIATLITGGFLIGFLLPRSRFGLSLVCLCLPFAIAITSTSAFFDGTAIPLAIIYLIFSIFVSSTAQTDRQANFTLAHGIITAVATTLLGEFSPFPQITLPYNQVITPIIWGALVGSIFILVGFQFFRATLRIRLVIIMLAIVIIPLVILSLIQSQMFFSAVFAGTHEPVKAAAQETTNGIDSIFDGAQKSIAENDYSDAGLRAVYRTRTILFTTLIAGLTGLLAIAIAQYLFSPIVLLTNVAQQIARGNLKAQAPESARDELGMLGMAFNRMTGQLNALINQLEERVRVRTGEIQHQNEILADRARRFKTVSDVARQIVSAQELETLLHSITQLISERFGFYHVGVFLLDENKTYAVLRAANSEGGQRMLARNHRLLVGKVGIVGYVTGTGEPRIATNVGEDAVFFNNPDLPATRSEMALPLKVNQQTIGAIDFQSTTSIAFHPDEIDLFTTLADQVAIAIYNNQLYMETLHALNEAQEVHRQYLRSEWATDTAHRKTLGYVYNHDGIMPQQQENPMWAEIFQSGQPVFATTPCQEDAPQRVEAPLNALMAVPISIRGETIGVIQVQDQGENRSWSEEEVTVVNEIANQVAVALENARLFENTARRADREKKVMEITARIRATNDPNEMMQIAIRELQQALHASRAQIYIHQAENAEPGRPTGRNGNSNGDILPAAKIDPLSPGDL